MSTVLVAETGVFLGLSSTGWTAITGAATALLALAAIIQGFAIRKQSSQTQEQIDISSRNVEAAQQQSHIAQEQADLTRESVAAAVALQKQSLRAGADREAPRVSIYFKRPKAPRACSSRDFPLISEQSDKQSRKATGEEFILSRDHGTFIWFCGEGMIINEGPGSARVRLPRGAKFVEGRNFRDLSEVVGVPVLVDNANDAWTVLAPEEKALFVWADGKTLGEWIVGAQHSGDPIYEQGIWMWVTVFDPRGIGVIDTHTAYFQPDFLAPVQSLEGHWKVNEADSYGEVGVMGMHRGYTNEGAGSENLSVRNKFLGVYLED